MTELLFSLDSIAGKVFVIALIILAFCAGFIAGYATCRWGGESATPQGPRR
jgi:hypothetical protein